jgi:hypothetical protein
VVSSQFLERFLTECFFNGVVLTMLESSRFSLKHLLAGGIVLLTFGLLLEQLGDRIPQPISRWLPTATEPATASQVCSQVLKPKATISRQELAKLLTITPGKSRATIRGIVQEPYCKMPNLTLRVGATSEREAYPLEFDPRTWLVVLYEGDNYAGFDFVIR